MVVNVGEPWEMLELLHGGGPGQLNNGPDFLLSSWNIAGALVWLNGMNMYSQWPGGAGGGGVEQSLPYVPLLDPNQMVCVTQVQLSEKGDPMQMCKGTYCLPLPRHKGGNRKVG